IGYGRCGFRGPPRRLQSEFVSNPPDDRLICFGERPAVLIEEPQILFGNVTALQTTAQSVNLSFAHLFRHETVFISLPTSAGDFKAECTSETLDTSHGGRAKNQKIGRASCRERV